MHELICPFCLKAYLAQTLWTVRQTDTRMPCGMSECVEAYNEETKARKQSAQEEQAKQQDEDPS